MVHKRGVSLACARVFVRVKLWDSPMDILWENGKVVCLEFVLAMP